MKKLFVAILAVLYMSTSIGATIELHYCMGRLVKWSLRYDDNSNCSNCGMEKKHGSAKGCCKDEYKRVKIDKDQNLTPKDIRLSQAITEIRLTVSGHSILPLLVSAASVTKINGPPNGCHTPLTILNCVLRI